MSRQTDYVKRFADDIAMIVTVYDDSVEPPRRGAWRDRVRRWLDNAPGEDAIQRAIDEWAAIGGGPGNRPNEPTLAHYIAVSLFRCSNETPQ